MPQTILLLASFKSMELSIMAGLLPPSSKVVGVKFSAAALATILPILTLPVKNI